MADLLLIGGFALDGFKAPQSVGAGGRHAMAVHKLPGGQRVVDTLGPDEADIHLSGLMFSDDAYSTCTAIDGMRAAGQEIPLVFGGQFRTVIVTEFTYQVHRMPMHCTWSISMLVVSNPALGAVGAIVSTIDSLVSSDLSAAVGF